MKFHLIVIALAGVSIYLIYIFIFGFQSDLEEARATIRKESVSSAKDISKINKQPELKPFINKVLTEKKVVTAPKLEASPFDIREIPPQMTSAINTADVFQSQLDEKSYWCKNVTLTVESYPVKCVFPDACFGCEGPIIPPEVSNTTPFCADGTISKLYHVECCPTGVVDGAVSCPTVEQCFNAELVPKDACTCQNSPECKIMTIDNKVDCVCAQ